jgi:hypothetical protein
VLSRNRLRLSSGNSDTRNGPAPPANRPSRIKQNMRRCSIASSRSLPRSNADEPVSRAPAPSLPTVCRCRGRRRRPIRPGCSGRRLHRGSNRSCSHRSCSNRGYSSRSCSHCSSLRAASARNYRSASWCPTYDASCMQVRTYLRARTQKPVLSSQVSWSFSLGLANSMRPPSRTAYAARASASQEDVGTGVSAYACSADRGLVIEVAAVPIRPLA